MDLVQALHKWFGYSSFRTGQKEIISSLVAGSDVLAMLPTGTGKSICYQLPAFLTPGLTMVVSPLLSLMQDQVQDLKSKGLKRVAALNSMISFDEKQEIFNNLTQYQILYVSPEMLQSDRLIMRLQQIRINYFIVDEAHCISHWGKSFRTDYLKLADVRQKLGMPSCLAITATATDVVRQDIVKHLHLHDPATYIYSVDRANIAIDVQHTTSVKEKLAKLDHYVSTFEGSGMIYVQSRKWAEAAADYLRNQGHTRTSFYHGGMSHEDRLLIQQQFTKGQLDYICCTSAFGMGINKANIRFVIHFHAPLDLESYVQEIGRAGRDGEPSIALLLHSAEDRTFSEAMLQRDTLDDNQLTRLLELFSNGGNYTKEEEVAVYSQVGCTDSGFNHLRYILEQKNIVNNRLWHSFEPKTMFQDIKNLLHHSKVVQDGRLENMWEWVHSGCCKRSEILSYFGETLTDRPASCCSICGIDYNRHEAHEKKQSNQPQALNWKKELQHVFGVK